MGNSKQIPQIVPFLPPISSLRREKLPIVDLCLKNLFQRKSPPNNHQEKGMGLDLQRFLLAGASPKGLQGWDAHPWHRHSSGNLCKVQEEPHLCLPRAHLLP